MVILWMNRNHVWKHFVNDTCFAMPVYSDDMMWIPQLQKIRRRSNEKVNSSSNWFDLVFLILSNFFEDTLYKSTLKSAIIRFVKSVCLHGKQTAGQNWAKINSTCLEVKFVDFGGYLSALYNLIVIIYHDVQWVPVLAWHRLGRL